MTSANWPRRGWCPGADTHACARLLWQLFVHSLPACIEIQVPDPVLRWTQPRLLPATKRRIQRNAASRQIELDDASVNQVGKPLANCWIVAVDACDKALRNTVTNSNCIVEVGRRLYHNERAEAFLLNHRIELVHALNDGWGEPTAALDEVRGNRRLEDARIGLSGFCNDRSQPPTCGRGNHGAHVGGVFKGIVDYQRLSFFS